MRLIRGQLSANPYMGEALERELTGYRAYHFHRDRYRLMWCPLGSSRQIHVICVEPKSPTLYDRAVALVADVAVGTGTTIRWLTLQVPRGRRGRKRRR